MTAAAMRLGWTLPSLWLVLMATSAQAAPTAARIFVSEGRKVALPEPFERTSLVAEVAKHLETRGCPVVGTCAGADCRLPLAPGVTDVIAIDAQYAREEFSCSVRVEARGLAGEVRFQSSYGNGTCPAGDLVERTKALAGRLCDQVMSAAPATVPPAAVVDSSAGPGSRVSVPGVSLVAGGAVLAGLGSYLWYLHGNCAHSGVVAGEERCGDRYDTRLMGVSLTLAGLAATGVGVWLLLDSNTTVAVAPGRLILARRF
jgi:hypothetical protein